MALGMKHSTSPAADRMTPLAMTVVTTLAPTLRAMPPAAAAPSSTLAVAASLARSSKKTVPRA